MKIIYRKDYLIEECIVTLARLIVAYNNLLISLIEETCDSGED